MSNMKVYEIISKVSDSSYRQSVKLPGQSRVKGDHVYNQGVEMITLTDNVLDTRKKDWETKKRLTQIRYVKGCPTIYVDEQEASNWGMEHQRSRHLETKIEVTGGRLEVDKETAEGQVLILYLDSLNQNGSNPNRDKNVPVVFRESQAEKILQEHIEDEFESAIITADFVQLCRDGKYSEIQWIAQGLQEIAPGDVLTKENADGPIARILVRIKNGESQKVKELLANKKDSFVELAGAAFASGMLTGDGNNLVYTNDEGVKTTVVSSDFPGNANEQTRIVFTAEWLSTKIGSSFAEQITERLEETLRAVA